jgi:multiple sugar transport system permease protein
MLTHKRRNLLVDKILPGILLAIVVLWAFFPIVNAIIGSFKMPLHIWDFPPRFFGRIYSLTNYQELIRDWPQYFGNLVNSLIVTGGTALVVILCSILGAYAFSRFSHRLVRLSTLFTIIIRMIPPIIVVIPLFPIFNV